MSLLVCILLLAGCKHSNSFILNADVKGLTSDSVLALFEFPEYRIDTIVAEDGKFTYEFPLDTLTLFTLRLDEVAVPVYAEKGGNVKLRGTKENVVMEGEGDNARMNEIMQLERACSIDLTMADSLIRAYPNSYTNLYVIRQALANGDTLDYACANNILQQMGGNLKDLVEVMRIQNVMDKHVGSSAYHLANNLLMKGRDNVNVSYADIKNRYVLLSFWATWDAASCAAQDSLVGVVNTLKKKPFVAISVSLDYDCDKWYKASNRDTTQWRQVCDGKGFENELVKALDIRKLPANVLLDPRRMLMGRDLKEGEIVKLIEGMSK
ncbi:MAG: thioredoxin-like domain-containing protein [Bacteroidales bacterium]|nr:thioredoxin-like domain-containing protein [Bacteroidales bacterium]